MMQIGKYASVVLVLSVGWQHLLLAGEAPREAVHRRAELEGREAEPEWKKELRRKLEEKISFEFVETPLSDALQFLSAQSKLSIILDPREERWNAPVNLQVQNMSLKLALEWILSLAGRGYALRDGALFVSTPERMTFDVVLRIYDVRDLTTPLLPEHSPPGIDALGTLWPKGQPSILSRELGEQKHLLYDSGLAELIQSRARPETWAPELGTSIEARQGRLVVMQRPSVHQEISELLRNFRRERALQVGVDARVLSVSEALLSKLRALQKPGEGTVFLRRPQLALIHKALQAGEEASLVDAASLTCLNGQRTHTLSGKTFEKKGERNSIQFRGTILDVRPMVSFDKKYVTMHLQLMRIEDEPVRVFKFSTTVTCLETDTVLLAGASLPDGRRLIALVTPTILHLEPAPEKQPARPGRP